MMIGLAGNARSMFSNRRQCVMACTRSASAPNCAGSRQHRSFHASSVSFEKGEKKKTALVVGSSGVLGSTVARYLSTKLKMSVIGADLLELPNISDWDLDGFVPLPHYSTRPSIGDLNKLLTSGTGYCLQENGPENGGDGSGKLDLIVVASGGWEGDPPSQSATASPKEIERGAEECGATVEKMLAMNLHPVVASGYVASRFMAENGLFVVIGATPALSPSPGMMGYGMAKVSAHHYVQSMGAASGMGISRPKQRKEARKLRIKKSDEYLDTLTAIGILPTTIDTPNNRDTMKNANFDDWTKPIDIATEIGTWMEQPYLRPHSGSLIKVFPSKGDTGGATFQLVRG
eukprot:scaffold32620_cov55-Attheya_sp.AAC.1